MPEVKEAVAITALYGQPREGMHRHVFVGSNFVMEGMLQDHRDELATAALPEEMDAAMKRTAEFLKTQAAKVTIGSVDRTANGVAVEVHVENLGGHKLPTAYPSRRAWLHVVVRDGSGHVVFESGELNPDGFIVGNDNDEDPLKFEPHYREITSPEQVEIYEPILKDSQGKVTTGLLHAVGYLKDNRLLPHGFDKATADEGHCGDWRGGGRSGLQRQGQHGAVCGLDRKRDGTVQGGGGALVSADRVSLGAQSRSVQGERAAADGAILRSGCTEVGYGAGQGRGHAVSEYVPCSDTRDEAACDHPACQFFVFRNPEWPRIVVRLL